MISLKSCRLICYVIGSNHPLPGGRDVAYYRLYLLSVPSGRFVGFEEIEAEDDVSAIQAAEAHLGPQPLELWCGKRKIRTFPAKEPMTGE